MAKQKPTRLIVKLVSLLCALLLVVGVGYIKFRPHSAPHVTATAQTVSATAEQPEAEAETPAKPAPHQDEGLQSIVDTWAAQHSFASSVVVQELDGDLRTADHRPAAQMTTASTYKIYVAYAVLHEVEQGTYTMQTVTRSGQTVSAALNKMILQSDNTTAEALGFLVGWDRVNQLAAQAGATQTDINNYNSAGIAANGNKLSTATDLTAMVTKLEQGKLLNATNTELLLGLMKTQVWRQRVPAGVPTGIPVADKPGWLDGVQNDAAVVYGPKSIYTLVIMTSGNSTKALADLSRLVYDYLQS